MGTSASHAFLYQASCYLYPDIAREYGTANEMRRDTEHCGRLNPIESPGCFPGIPGPYTWYPSVSSAAQVSNRSSSEELTGSSGEETCEEIRGRCSDQVECLLAQGRQRHCRGWEERLRGICTHCKRPSLCWGEDSARRLLWRRTTMLCLIMFAEGCPLPPQCVALQTWLGPL